MGVQTEVRGLGELRSRCSDGSAGRGGESGVCGTVEGFPAQDAPPQHDVILVFLVMEPLTQPFPKTAWIFSLGGDRDTIRLGPDSGGILGDD